jgi:hypothetical protein
LSLPIQQSQNTFIYEHRYVYILCRLIGIFVFWNSGCEYSTKKKQVLSQSCTLCILQRCRPFMCFIPLLNGGRMIMTNDNKC